MPNIIKKGALLPIMTFSTVLNLTGIATAAFRWSSRTGASPTTVIGTGTLAEVSADSTGSVYTYAFAAGETATPGLFRGEITGTIGGKAVTAPVGDGFFFTIADDLS